MDARICTGVGADGGNSTLTRVSTRAGCEAFAAESPTLTFNGTNELCTDVDCNSLTDSACGHAYHTFNVSEQCRAMCGTCGEPEVPCIVDADGRTVRFFGGSSPERYAPSTYQSVCRAFSCTRVGFEVEVMATRYEDPGCSVSTGHLDRLDAAENADQLGFFYVAIPILFLATPAIAYWWILDQHPDGWDSTGWPQSGGSKRFRYSAAAVSFFSAVRKLPWSVHQFVWLGLVLRLADMSTDWAFWDINIGLPSDTDDGRFAIQYAGDASAVQIACIVFLGLGTVLTPCDIWGSLQRCKHKSGAGPPTTYAIAVSLLEDIPQLAINCLYISAVGLGTGASRAITVVSLVFSALAIMYTWRTIYRDIDEAGGCTEALRRMCACRVWRGAANPTPSTYSTNAINESFPGPTTVPTDRTSHESGTHYYPDGNARN